MKKNEKHDDSFLLLELRKAAEGGGTDGGALVDLLSGESGFL